MLRIRRALQAIACVGLMSVSTGCFGGPGSGWGYAVKEGTPGNRLALGGGRELILNSTTDVVMTGVDLGRDGPFTNHFKAATVTLKQDKASWDGIVSAIDRNNTARGMYYQHINDVMDRVPAILDRFVPLAKDYLAMAGNVAMQRMAKPSLVQQIAAGLMGQHFDLGLVKGVFDAVDLTIATDAAALLKSQVPGVVVPETAPPGNDSKPPGTPARSDKPLQAKFALVGEDELIELHPR